MDAISEQELAGYTEDREALRRFMLPYRLLKAVGLALSLAGVCTAVFLTDAWFWRGWKIAFIAGLLLVIGTSFAVRFGSPVCRGTGRPMRKYRSREADGNKRFDLVYVCHDSRTYFKRRYRIGGGL